MGTVGAVGLDSNGVSSRTVRVKHIIMVCPQNECIVAGKSQILVY